MRVGAYLSGRNQRAVRADKEVVSGCGKMASWKKEK